MGAPSDGRSIQQFVGGKETAYCRYLVARSYFAFIGGKKLYQ
jgi:hypothetical protein